MQLVTTQFSPVAPSSSLLQHSVLEPPSHDRPRFTPIHNNSQLNVQPMPPVFFCLAACKCLL